MGDAAVVLLLPIPLFRGGQCTRRGHSCSPPESLRQPSLTSLTLAGVDNAVQYKTSGSTTPRGIRQVGRVDGGISITLMLSKDSQQLLGSIVDGRHQGADNRRAFGVARVYLLARKGVLIPQACHYSPFAGIRD